MPDKKLAEVFFEHQGQVSDKWEQYLGIYEFELASLIARDRAIALLEIGIQNGGSLEIWRKYLPEGSRVTGIDIDERCANIPLQSDIEIIICDASNRESLDTALGARIFDVIIDDGSHVSGHIIATFKALFPRLRPGGKFIIEDLHACYFASFKGGYRHPGSAIEWLKNIVDWLNIDHFDGRLCAENLADIRSAPNEIARVTFYDSVAVIEKLPVTKQAPYRRVLAGHEATVVSPAKWLSNAPALASLVVSEGSGLALERGLKDELVAMRKSAHEAAAEAKERLSAREKEIAHFSAQLRQERERYGAETARLETSLAERFSELTALNRLWGEISSRAEQQETALSAAYSRAAEAEARAERSKTEIVQLTENVSELNELVLAKSAEAERHGSASAKALSQAAALEARAEEQVAEIARLEASLGDLNRLLEAKSTEAEQLSSATSHALSRVAELETHAERQADEIARLEARVAERFNELATLSALLRTKEEEADRRGGAATSASARVAELEARATRQAGEIAGLEANVAERFGELATLSGLLKAKEEEVDLADASVKGLGAQLAAIQDSIAWKATSRLVQALKPIGSVRRQLKLQRKLVQASGLFDGPWYLAQNPDVAADGADPLDHFLLFGGQEGRNPSEAFDSKAYLRTHADVEAAGINPLVHYLMYGRAEKRTVAMP